jgi:ABC-type multidrug transport system fused ATPase/permease subunit
MSLSQVVFLKEFRQWPLLFSEISVALKNILVLLGETIALLSMTAVNKAMENPLHVAFQASTLVALLLLSLLPKVEHQRKVRPISDVEEETIEDPERSLFGSVKTLSNLGISSASRLGLLSKSGALEGTLERWRSSLPDQDTVDGISSFHSVLRLAIYAILSLGLFALPIFVHSFAGASQSSLTKRVLMDWGSTIDVSALLLVVMNLSWNAVTASVVSCDYKPHVMDFVKTLANTVVEVSSLDQSTQTQFGSPISPSKGLSVRDLWAAHTAKRAWAVRGASLDCPNGEVHVILGDDGAGKSRLLTAIAESMIFPTRQALTTTKVRGSVCFGGLDSAKWDRTLLKKQLGLFLNDVRTVSDNAEFMSGFTLEEILEPMDGRLSTTYSTGTRESSAINLALQVSHSQMTRHFAYSTL